MNLRLAFRFLPIFLIALLRPHFCYSQDSTLRVMTYNIRLPVPDDGINYWGNRRSLVVSMFGYHEPDLIGVQEAFRRQINEIITDMPEYGWFGVCRTDGSTNPNPDGEFSAILYRKDRLRLIDGGTFWLSETPDRAGSVGWDAALPRIVTWAQFRDKQTEKDFFHFNTHFDHMGVKAREESAKLLLHRIDSIAGEFPVVLTGDFNCGFEDPPYQVLTDLNRPDHLLDALAVTKTRHHGPRSTFSSTFQISGLKEVSRIDYIFVKNKVEVLRHAILSDNWYGKLASDHLPVLAQVELRK